MVRAYVLCGRAGIDSLFDVRQGTVLLRQGTVLEGINRKFCRKKAQLADIFCLLSLK